MNSPAKFSIAAGIIIAVIVALLLLTWGRSGGSHIHVQPSVKEGTWQNPGTTQPATTQEQPDGH